MRIRVIIPDLLPKIIVDNICIIINKIKRFDCFFERILLFKIKKLRIKNIIAGLINNLINEAYFISSPTMLKSKILVAVIKSKSNII
jgi:hypothetical protein